MRQSLSWPVIDVEDTGGAGIMGDKTKRKELKLVPSAMATPSLTIKVFRVMD